MGALLVDIYMLLLDNIEMVTSLVTKWLPKIINALLVIQFVVMEFSGFNLATKCNTLAELVND